MCLFVVCVFMSAVCVRFIVFSCSVLFIFVCCCVKLRVCGVLVCVCVCVRVCLLGVVFGLLVFV